MGWTFHRLIPPFAGTCILCLESHEAVCHNAVVTTDTHQRAVLMPICDAYHVELYGDGDTNQRGPTRYELIGSDDD
jgi:hypothetical protein